MQLEGWLANLINRSRLPLSGPKHFKANPIFQVSQPSVLNVHDAHQMIELSEWMQCAATRTSMLAEVCRGVVLLLFFL